MKTMTDFVIFNANDYIQSILKTYLLQKLTQSRMMVMYILNCHWSNQNPKKTIFMCWDKKRTAYQIQPSAFLL